MPSEKKKSSNRTWYWTARDLRFHSSKKDWYKGPVGFHIISAGTRCYKAAIIKVVKRRLEIYEGEFIPVHLEGMVRYVPRDALLTKEEYDNRLAEARAKKAAGIKALSKKRRGIVDKD